MATIPYADPSHPAIWGGLLTYRTKDTDAVIDAFVAFGDNVASDEASSSLIYWYFTPAAGTMLLASLDNVANVPSARAFDGFLHIPALTSTLRSASMVNITDELSAVGGVR
jgi:hypothetical protein